MRRALILAWLVASASNAVSAERLYPICFYNSARPDLEELEAYYVPRLIEAFRSIAYISEKAKVVVTPDGRWIIADTSNSQNLRLLKMWPRVACIGNAVNSDRVKAQEACTDYISSIITSSDYTKFGEIEVAGNKVKGEFIKGGYALFCKTVSTKSDP